MDPRLRALLPSAPRAVTPWPRGSCAVWRVELDTGPVWIKQHGPGRGFAQERRGLRWAAGLWAPRLLAWDEAAGALLLGHLEGEAATPTPAVHHAAGAWLAQLHALPVADPDPVPLAEALHTRARRTLARAEGRVPEEALERARARLLAPQRGAGLGRVPTHRDFTPQNWRMGARFGVLDFEHSALDHPLVDLVRLAGGVWLRDPSLKTAFLEGYSRALSPAEENELAALRWAWALDTLSWGQRHRHPGFIALGEEALGPLLAGA